MFAILFLATLGAADEPARSDADPAYVPADAQMFFTLRVADSLATEQVQKMLAQIGKLGLASSNDPITQLKALEEKAGLKLSDVERVTMVATDLSKTEMWIVIQTKKDIDLDKILALMQDPQEKTAVNSAKKYHWQKKNDIGFYLAGPRLALVAPRRGMERSLALSGKDEQRGPLAGAVKLASGKRFHAVAAVDIWNMLPVEAHEVLTQTAKGDGPEAAAAEFLLKTKTISYTARYDKKLELQVAAEFRNADAAKRALPAAQRLLDFARTTAKDLAKETPEFSVLVEALQQVKLSQADATVVARMEVDQEVLMTTLLAAVQKVRQAAARTITQDNMHNIGLAIHNYASAHAEKFPQQAIRDKNGKPLLSWRVELLNDVEESALYKQFKLDESWDSPHNIKLLDKMPKVYECPHLPAAKPGHTYFQVCSGPDTIFPLKGQGPTNLALTSIKGNSNAILFALGAKPVPWTKPDDIVIDKEPIKPKLLFGPDGTMVMMADGAIHMVKPTVKEKTLRSAILMSDTDPLGEDWNDDSPRKPKSEKRDK